MIKFCSAVLGLAIAASVLAQPVAVSSNDRVANWEKDLHLFATQFPANQMDFSKLYDSRAFAAEVTSISNGLPAISDTEIILRLSRLIASAGVAHNAIGWPPGEVVPFPEYWVGYPLKFEWYSDGLVVTSASAEFADILGARVIRFGGLTVDQILQKLSPYISHETEAGLRTTSEEELSVSSDLKYLGVVGKDGTLSLMLETPGGKSVTVSVHPTENGSAQSSFTEALHITKPLFLSRSDTYWFQYLAESGTLYIQYNKCENDPEKPFESFGREVLAIIDSNRVRRVVIDLRRNGGGDRAVMWGLMSGLKSRLGKISGVYVLIGGWTFSSAVMNAVELRYNLKAVLAGETAGETVVMYYDPRLFTLPYSKLTVVSTSMRMKYPGVLLKGLPASSSGLLEPDFRIPRTIEDALHGRDPVLEAVIGR